MIRLVEPDVREEDIAAVAAVLRSGHLVQGANVRRFEDAVADYLGVRHAVAVSSGTAALHLALMALEIGPGDEVIVPDFTFPATANVVSAVGATPVLVDIDLATYNLDVTQLEGACTDRTRAIMPVHLFGLAAEMDAVMELAARRGLAVVEDAACALGSTYRGRRCGAIGHLNCLSFHPRKIITTGEGGMVTTDHEALAERVRLLRSHGMVARNGRVAFEAAGLNYRLTDFQGALGVVQMQRLEEMIACRRALAACYDGALAGLADLARPAEPSHLRHIFQAYVVLLDPAVSRDGVIAALRADGMEATIGTHAVSAQPYYRRANGCCPRARHAYEHGLCLPLHSRMREADALATADALVRAAAAHRR